MLSISNSLIIRSIVRSIPLEILELCNKSSIASASNNPISSIPSYSIKCISFKKKQNDSHTALLYHKANLLDIENDNFLHTALFHFIYFHFLFCLLLLTFMFSIDFTKDMSIITLVVFSKSKL